MIYRSKKKPFSLVTNAENDVLFRIKGPIFVVERKTKENQETILKRFCHWPLETLFQNLQQITEGMP